MGRGRRKYQCPGISENESDPVSCLGVSTIEDIFVWLFPCNFPSNFLPFLYYSLLKLPWKKDQSARFTINLLCTVRSRLFLPVYVGRGGGRSARVLGFLGMFRSCREAVFLFGCYHDCGNFSKIGSHSLNSGYVTMASFPVWSKKVELQSSRNFLLGFEVKPQQTVHTCLQCLASLIVLPCSFKVYFIAGIWKSIRKEKGIKMTPKNGSFVWDRIHCQCSSEKSNSIQKRKYLAKLNKLIKLHGFNNWIRSFEVRKCFRYCSYCSRLIMLIRGTAIFTWTRML